MTCSNLSQASRAFPLCRKIVRVLWTRRVLPSVCVWSEALRTTKWVGSLLHPNCGQWLESSQRLLIRPRPMAGTGAESRALDREAVVRNLSHEPRCQRRRAGYCPSTGPPLLVQVRKWRYRSCTYSAVSFTNFNVVEFPWRSLGRIPTKVPFWVAQVDLVWCGCRRMHDNELISAMDVVAIIIIDSTNVIQ